MASGIYVKDCIPRAGYNIINVFVTILYDTDEENVKTFEQREKIKSQISFK